MSWFLSGPAPESGAIAGIGQNWELRIFIMDVKVPPWGVPWHIGLGSHPTHYPSRAHLVFYLYNGPLLGHLKRYLISALSRNWDPIFLGILSLPKKVPIMVSDQRYQNIQFRAPMKSLIFILFDTWPHFYGPNPECLVFLETSYPGLSFGYNYSRIHHICISDQK